MLVDIQHLILMDNFATKLYGEFNTKTCEGFKVEVFIPWYELGF